MCNIYLLCDSVKLTESGVFLQQTLLTYYGNAPYYGTTILHAVELVHIALLEILLTLFPELYGALIFCARVKILRKTAYSAIAAPSAAPSWIFEYILLMVTHIVLLASPSLLFNVSNRSQSS